MGFLGWSLTVVGLLIGLVSMMAVVGSCISPSHVATRSLALKHPPAEVFQLFEKTDQWPSWWKLLKTVEKLPDRDGKPALRLSYQDGNQFDLILTESSPPGRFVTEIDDVNKMFSGSWTYEVSPSSDGCTLRITENGTVPNPIIRLIARLTMDPAMYIKICLSAVAEKFGEPADIQP